ncbi:hypothetical protein FKG94_20925 [Exilibacterium tricleocarpae]|uniref:Uncharacterized protein n=1 Tax=Exilibacterium tricleocarpae TaxID=2591008 RepID=A0A545T0R9_9GAMM|nr:hypothetical protein [Exilibacterium tricleocarpae]TQV70791.1 hypothetical protein FKG94_20925 [Exilibacterium tricleocarpae]
MAGNLHHRFRELLNVVEAFNASLDENLVICEIEDNPIFINFDYKPISQSGCNLNITIDKCVPCFLTINIGKKIFYEEYEGQRLPNADYLNELMNSVSQGCVTEEETFSLGKCILHKGHVKLDSYEDIQVERKSIFGCMMPSRSKKSYEYKPWTSA